MPELPEVERARRALLDAAGGKRVVWLKAEDDRIVFADGAQTEIKGAVEGRVLADVERKGKHLCLLFEPPSQVCMHLGMTGALAVQGTRSISYQSLRKGNKRSNDELLQEELQTDWPPRFCKFEIEVEGGAKVAFTDPRRLGRVRVVPDRSNAPFWASLGPDVMHELPSDEELGAMLSKRPTSPVKAVILDQSFLSGIGNWIADEVLFQSRLHPERRVKTLCRREIKALRESIDYVIRLATESNANSALYPRDWLFHYRWTKKKESKTFDGATIKFCTVGSRTSAYVPSLQKNRMTMPNDTDKDNENYSPETMHYVKKETVAHQNAASECALSLQKRPKIMAEDGDKDDENSSPEQIRSLKTESTAPETSTKDGVPRRRSTRNRKARE